MKKYVLLKLLGLALLTMMVLVIISFLEVAVYAYFIQPGLAESAYETHANLTAPYISGIVGFITFFFVSRYWKKKAFPNAFKLSILFPLVYLVLDIIIITAAQVQWADYIIIFTIANAAKFLGSYLGYYLSK